MTQSLFQMGAGTKSSLSQQWGRTIQAFLGTQYRKLADAADADATGDLRYSGGTTEVWYMKPGVSRDLGMGLEFAQEHYPEAVPSYEHMSETHVLVGHVRETNPEQVWVMMQGETWSPQGEARNLIQRLGLSHTSMSIGDVLLIPGKGLLMADRHGFVKVPLKVPSGNPKLQASFTKTYHDAEEFHDAMVDSFGPSGTLSTPEQKDYMQKVNAILSLLHNLRPYVWGKN